MAVCCSGKGNTMGQATPVILSVDTPQYKHVRAKLSDGFVYLADLSSLSSVYCFPKDEKEWAQVTIDTSGYALMWKNRFEVHVDQIIGLSIKTEIFSTNKSYPLDAYTS